MFYRAIVQVCGLWNRQELSQASNLIDSSLPVRIDRVQSPTGGKAVGLRRRVRLEVDPAWTRHSIRPDQILPTPRLLERELKAVKNLSLLSSARNRPRLRSRDELESHITGVDADEQDICFGTGLNPKAMDLLEHLRPLDQRPSGVKPGSQVARAKSCKYVDSDSSTDPLVSSPLLAAVLREQNGSSTDLRLGNL